MKIPKIGQTIAIAFCPDVIAYCGVKEIVKTESKLTGRSAGIIVMDDPFVEGAVNKEDRIKWLGGIIQNRKEK